MATAPKNGKLIYHLTSLENLTNILKNGLRSRTDLSIFDDVAEAEIIDHRETKGLNNFVPFHFFGGTPFGGAVQNKYRNKEFVFITVRRTFAENNAFKILIQHPLSIPNPVLLPYSDGMATIDWDTMERRDYSDHNCSEVCMAECLSPMTIKPSDFCCIFTPDDIIKNKVIKLRDDIVGNLFYVDTNDNFFKKMIYYAIGNILDSTSQAIVNTVNCEGYMGKGIAYQFKIKYPNNNKKYVEACSANQFKIGSILTFKENDKLIINFPTKDEWRKRSEYSYISKGLETFIEILPRLNVKSIAFPPLGCGNGGLEWIKVKELITSAILPFEDYFDFTLYEPSTDISPVINKKRIPKLNASHIILMHLKLGLKKFNKTRLQKAAFLINVFSEEQYFKFNAYNFGPYTHTIDILSRDIKEYQQYYNFTTEQALNTAENTLMSNSLIEKLDRFREPILKSLELLNNIESDKELELISTILYILSEKKALKLIEFPGEFLKWSEAKASKFSSEDIESEILFLERKNIVFNSLLGVELCKY